MLTIVCAAIIRGTTFRMLILHDTRALSSWT
jgi:hypothetical protein